MNGLFTTIFLLMIVAIIVTIVFLIKYLVSVFKKNQKRKKNRIVTLVSLGLSIVLFVAMIVIAPNVPDSNENETAEKPKTHKVEKKTTNVVTKKNNKPKPKKNVKKPAKKPVKKATKSKEEPVKKSEKTSNKTKISKAEKNGKAYAKAINKLNMGTVEDAKYDYKNNVLTYIGYDDMLSWKHSDFKKTLPILESWALKTAPKYNIYTGKLKIELLSENKTPIAHWTNTDDWQFDR